MDEHTLSIIGMKARVDYLVYLMKNELSDLDEEMIRLLGKDAVKGDSSISAHISGDQIKQMLKLLTTMDGLWDFIHDKNVKGALQEIRVTFFRVIKQIEEQGANAQGIGNKFFQEPQ